jgi:hypothetical protein
LPIPVIGSLHDVEFRVASILAASEALLAMVGKIHSKKHWKAIVVVAQPQQYKLEAEMEADFQRGKMLDSRSHNMNMSSNTD